MTVDGGHYRLWKKKYRLVKTVEGWQEQANIAGAALAQPLQINAGGKDFALPGQHHCSHIRIAQVNKVLGKPIA